MTPRLPTVGYLKVALRTRPRVSRWNPRPWPVDGAEVAGVTIRPGLPKLVATDLDGTIVRSDNTVSARTMAAFDRVADAGIPIVGVTGRGPRLIELTRRDLPSADFLVLAQGGHVVDVTVRDQSRTLFAACMPGAVVTSVLAALEAVVGPLSLLVEPVDAPDAMLWGECHPVWRFPDAVRRCARADALIGSVVKAFVHSDAYTTDELLEIAVGLIGCDVVELTQAGLGYVEICPPGVTKAKGLAIVASHLGVDAQDVLVFGDMPNDLPMFAWAGWSQVAVANAHPAVIAAAAEITEGNDDDGVAVYLDRLLSGR